MSAALQKFLADQKAKRMAAQSPAPTTAAGAGMVWNEEQLQAISFAATGKSFCLIGAAGTGKTTTVKQVGRECIARNLPRVQNTTSRVLRNGLPGIVLVSFTNRAVRNLAHALLDIPELVPHCLTIHRVLEFGPVYYDVLDNDTGQVKKTMRFMPGRTAENPLYEAKLCIVDEASMPNAVFIFLGDLNQLTPVFGDAILGFKLSEIPVVELTRVYRQALSSPIVAFQHKFTLAGFRPSDGDLEEITQQGSGLQFLPVHNNPAASLQDAEQRDFANAQMVAAFGAYFKASYESGKYVPGEDIILMPHNKGFGQVEMNKHIAQFVGEASAAEVHEVIAGRETHYFAVGDHIVYDKREWHIINIDVNASYVGSKTPQPPSAKLDRWGVLHGKRTAMEALDAIDAAANTRLDRILDVMDKALADGEDIENAASHRITLREIADAPQERVLETRGEINEMSFGYAITIHKSQGSEWRKVYLFMLAQHASMFSRELLYTGMTRAREELIVFYSPNKIIGKKQSSIARCIERQSIPGKTWREKTAYFAGKWEDYRAIMESESGSIF
jgi:hypothetical protein